MGEPWCLPLEHVKRLTRAQVFGEYFHPRDKYGRLKLWPKKRRRGKVAHAPFPPLEELRIPDEAFRVVRPSGVGVQADYVCQWWSIWRWRQEAKQLPPEILTDEAVLERWRQEIQSGSV